MLDGQTEYFVYVLGLAAAVRFQFRQKQARGLQLVQQNFRTRDSFGNRLMEHLAVVPDAKRILQICQPFELRLHVFVTDIVKKLGPVAQIFGGHTKRV